MASPLLKWLAGNHLLNAMFIQKVFHVHQGIDETKAALAAVHRYRRSLDGVQKAVITEDGVAQFDCAVPHGMRTHCVIAELPTPDANQVLFHSTAGNIAVSGLIEYVAIRPDCTEVQLTLEYSFKSPLYKVADFATHSVERFINCQLRRIEGHLAGSPAPASAASTPFYTARIPQLAH